MPGYLTKRQRDNFVFLRESQTDKLSKARNTFRLSVSLDEEHPEEPRHLRTVTQWNK
jgi:hypothetical protein